MTAAAPPPPAADPWTPGAAELALVARLRRHLRDRVAGQRWVVSGDVLPATVHLVQTLQDLGAEDVFAVAASAGVGAPPPCGHAVLGAAGADMMGAIRAGQAALEAPLPPAVQARLDAFDPAGTARVLRCLFASDAPVGGRAAWGSRPLAWRALEDKSTVDALWDAVGVARAPARVVAAAAAPLRAAHAALDAGAGTVWALDNQEGWHGGAAGLRWVPHGAGPAALAAAVDWAGAHAAAVRVMPFLEGVPCSIHGIVTAASVVALRPCEMVVLRRPDTLRFAYAQAATFWDPAPADREAMRAVVRQTGAWLRDKVGYRGVFTVDGILSRAGFRPTELNPRFGGAIGKLSAALPALPLYLLHLALVEEGRTGGSGTDWEPAALEALLLRAADANRVGGAMQVLSRPCPAPRSLGLVCGPGGDWRPAAPDEAPHATARWGPGAAGSVLLVGLAPGHTPVGPMVAPRVVALFAALDRLWDLGIGPLAAARAVR